MPTPGLIDAIMRLHGNKARPGDAKFVTEGSPVETKALSIQCSVHCYSTTCQAAISVEVPIDHLGIDAYRARDNIAAAGWKVINGKPLCIRCYALTAAGLEAFYADVDSGTPLKQAQERAFAENKSEKPADETTE